MVEGLHARQKGQVTGLQPEEVVAQDVTHVALEPQAGEVAAEYPDGTPSLQSRSPARQVPTVWQALTAVYRLVSPPLQS